MRAALLGVLALFSSSLLPAADPPAVEPAVRLVEQHRFEEARRQLEPLVARDGTGTAAFWLGRIAMRRQDFDTAVDWLEKAVEAAPARSEHHLWLGRALGQKAIRASVLKQPFLAKKVQARYLEAVRLDPANLDARFDLEEFYLVAPGVMGGSVEKAQEQAREIERRDPMRGLRATARLHEQKKETDAAERLYRDAIERFPKETDPPFWLANHYMRRKETAKALDTLEALVATNPSAITGYYAIARIAITSDVRLDRAEECLKLYLQKEPAKDDPPLAWARYRLGSIYEKKGNRSAAKTEYENSLRLDPALKEVQEALKRVS